MTASEIANAIITEPSLPQPDHTAFLETLRPLIEAVIEQTLAIVEESGRYTLCSLCGSERACSWCDLDRNRCTDCGEEYACPACEE